MEYKFSNQKNAKKGLFNKKIIWQSFWQSIIKLNFKYTFKTPTIFLTEIACLISLFFIIRDFANGQNIWFSLQLFFWMMLTVIFANFAESLATLQGKAQTESLRSLRDKMKAKKLKNPSSLKDFTLIEADELKLGDILLCEAGDIIPIDGEVIEGIATVDESPITGESAPVIRESGSDRSLVTSGTKVISDFIKIKTTAEKGAGFLDRMIHLIESTKRKKTPSELSLTVMLSSFAIVFLLATMSLNILFEDFLVIKDAQIYNQMDTITHMAIVVCLMPTTIGALTSVIGISAMNRLFSKKVVALNGHAVESAGDIDLLIIDKTGTITLGNRQATEFIPRKNVDIKSFAKIAQLVSVSDETPEGRSVVVLAKKKYGFRAEALDSQKTTFIPFSASTRMSGLDIKDKDKTTIIRKGAFDAIDQHIKTLGGYMPPDLIEANNRIAKMGGTPIVVCKDEKPLGVIHLKDIVKGGIKQRFSKLKKMGIKTLMVTGDNPLTSAAIAAEAGIDDFLAQATPEKKLTRIKQEQKSGLIVAMTGDGTNDAPALAQADVGVAMNTGTKAAREAGNMIDLDSNPTKIIEIVETGKQMLITRGGLTTFSFANDVAKYFSVLPVLFSTLYGTSQGTNNSLAIFNILNLASFQSAILSTVAFNALIILALLPLALRGAVYKPSSPKNLLSKNLFIYGIAGITVPVVSIKIIDWLINYFNLI